MSRRAAPLRKGDLVEVLDPGAILATLDERGELAGMPFMPEMVDLCGRRFTVAARAQRVCDTITWTGMRGMDGVVVLERVRCDGAGHGGCGARCLVYWNEAWLRPVAPGDPVPAIDPQDLDRLRAVVVDNATAPSDGTTRFRCQATQALEASAPLSPVRPVPYLREWTSGNVSLTRFARVAARALRLETAKKLHRLDDPPLRGTSPRSECTPQTGLRPGDRVRVRSRDEIEATLNDKGKNRGLWFDREMLEFCGEEFEVSHRVERLIDEGTGEMIELGSDCIALDGAVCSGEHSVGRWFCPRAIYPYWREGWLERVTPEVLVEIGSAAASGSTGG